MEKRVNYGAYSVSAINECLNATIAATCDHYCVDTEFSYLCYCRSGYLRQEDGKTCKGTLLSCVCI